MEAVAEEPDSVDEQPVGGALDLKVAEEGVCAEQADYFVEDVVAFAVRVGRLVGRRGCWWQCVGWAAGFRAQRQQREVANQARRVRVAVEDGVVGLLVSERCRAEDVRVRTGILVVGVRLKTGGEAVAGEAVVNAVGSWWVTSAQMMLSRQP